MGQNAVFDLIGIHCVLIWSLRSRPGVAVWNRVQFRGRRRIGKRHQEAELIAPEDVVGGAIGKQVELLFLDAVFYLPAGTVDLLMEW